VSLVQINHGREAGIIRRNADNKEKIMLERIQVFTRGCSRSIVVEKNLRKAALKMGLNIEVEASDDPLVAKSENILSFPSVKINGELRVDGSFTTVGQFEEMLSEYL
jgi:predicted thioredoxin/glutaredoxin